MLTWGLKQIEDVIDFQLGADFSEMTLSLKNMNALPLN